MQQAQPSISPGQALDALVGLGRQTKLTYDEHMQLSMCGQILKNELEAHNKTKVELQAAQEELKKLRPVEAPSNPAE